MQIQMVAIDRVKPYERNPRKNADAIEKVAASLQEYGWRQPIVVDENMVVVVGHTRLFAAQRLQMQEVPVHIAEGLTPLQIQAYRIADNRTGEEAEWDEDLLRLELADMDLAGIELGRMTGFDADELAEIRLPAGAEGGDSGGGTGAAGSLAARFGVAPFSVLNAREGWWQERKRAWLALGIRSEVGRGENLLKMSDTMLEPDPVKRAKMQNGKRPAAAFGQDLMKGEHTVGQPDQPPADATSTGTSIFDPVLCELAYRWFCPPGGVILDPFAGGSVRGIVAARLGRRYLGVDLRHEQVMANRDQAGTICADGLQPEWVHGDSGLVLPTLDVQADFVWTCPPYGDLEVYSDQPEDLSNMPHHAFLKAYNDIIAEAVAKLRQDRFAAVVVGDFRDGRGFYRNFVSDTIQAFQLAGATLYNEAILVTAAGSLPIRAGKQFAATRKLGKTHQNLLVFCKGDPIRATQAVGECDFGEGAPEGDEAFGEPL